jgi:hypothetical protein
MHLHALRGGRALRSNLYHRLGFIAIELNGCLIDIHVLIAESGFGQVIQNTLMHCLTVLICAATTD